MNRRGSRISGRAALLACALAMGFGLPPAIAQTPPADAPPVPPAPTQFDPSDVYFQGYLLSREGEQLMEQKKFSEALEKLQRAQELYDRIATIFPEWKRDMVQRRLTKNRENIGVAAPPALKERERQQTAVANLEGRSTLEGVVRGAPGEVLNTLPPAPMPGMTQADTLATRRIAELENRVRQLQQQMREANANSGSAPTPAPAPAPNSTANSRTESRLEDVSRQRDHLQAELKEKSDELNRLRERFAQQPMQEEMQRLTGRLENLEQERKAMSDALGQSQKETREAQAQISALQQERRSLMQKTADLEASLKIERDTQNAVIAGQQAQLQQMREALRGKDDELAHSNQKIAALEYQLNEVRASVNDLRSERDALELERNQMASLLKLNEAGQLQQLIDQNMGLAKQLREANEKVDRLNADGNATKDELAGALNDILIAKRSINEFKREKIAQERRIDELERRLKGEDQRLSGQKDDSGEADVLRGIIRKQLRVQDRRRQARDLLMEAVGEKAKEDPQIASALNLIDGAEMPLTVEELALLNSDGVDGQFVSPIPRNKNDVDYAVNKLDRENIPYTAAGTRAFLNDRLQSARELFELAIERNPGDVPTRCRLGTILLRLKDPGQAANIFREASAIDMQNPYAQRMLGYSLMQTGNAQDAQEALAALKRSIELAPSNPDGHVILGKLQFDLSQEKEAEAEFKTAIQCDDAQGGPYYNLAYLCAQQGRKKEGLAFYQEALKRNVPPDLALEKRLTK